MFGLRSKAPIHPTLAASIGEEFNDHELAVLSRLSTIVSLEAGTTLITEGTVGQEAIVLVSGTAAITRNDEPISTVGAGTILGESALITGAPRNATVRAIDGVEVAALSRQGFQSFLDACPRVARIVNQLVEARQEA